MTKRNLVAASLRHGHYYQRVVESGKVYDRKKLRTSAREGMDTVDNCEEAGAVPAASTNNHGSEIKK